MEWVSATCNYGDDFIASVSRGNVHAVQFHPEKSGGILSSQVQYSLALLFARLFLKKCIFAKLC